MVGRPRESRRRRLEGAEKIERLRIPARRDLGHVPEHRLAGVQVDGADEEQSTFLVLPGNGVEQRPIDLLADTPPQRRIVRHRVARHGSKNRTLPRHVGRGCVDVEVLEPAVVVRPQEGEGCDQGTGTEPRHQLELRAVAGGGAAIEEPRTEGAVVSAPRDGQEHRRRQGPTLSAGPQIRLLPPDRGEALLENRIIVDADAIAHIGQARHDGLRGECRRHRLFSHQARTTLAEHQHRAYRNQQPANLERHRCSPPRG